MGFKADEYLTKEIMTKSDEIQIDYDVDEYFSDIRWFGEDVMTAKLVISMPPDKWPLWWPEIMDGGGLNHLRRQIKSGKVQCARKVKSSALLWFNE